MRQMSFALVLGHPRGNLTAYISRMTINEADIRFKREVRRRRQYKVRAVIFGQCVITNVTDVVIGIGAARRQTQPEDPHQCLFAPVVLCKGAFHEGSRRGDRVTAVAARFPRGVTA